MTTTITSNDGTTLAVDITGSGPALVIVAGAFCDRHSKKGLSALLTGLFTVHEYDRRGRGNSGPLGENDPRLEIEDLAAVAALTGEEPFVFGDSSGGALALAAAAAGVHFRKIAVYEPPFTSGPSSIFADELSALVASGDRTGAVERFLGLMGTPAPAIQGMKQGPHWGHLEAFAHTLPADVRLCNEGRIPADELARIQAPILAMAGSHSPWALDVIHAIAAASPTAEALTLAGQGHAVPDEVLSQALVTYFQ
ncbi:alpha/beta fold hydrolase [Paenarthrobacter sp. AR 02]|uniref:alpha/beta fold hydrolase n=1 Tax=Paenarthrobacter sp. AR 02 TaxID=2899821 RepID=UPI001F2CD1D7|nr:alpha/beta hydrolase [Paenarthrobacter sp. AR 02]MCF3139859.1 alpha/beta fold hydrolase [Paenarthrobacter sp. AR 02]